MRQTRGDKNVHWIEMFCLVPRRPDKGERVVLTQAQRETVRMIYDNPNSPRDVPITGSLAAYLALFHICGPEALQHDFRPDVAPRHLHGLGQRWPRFASRVEARW